MITINKLKGLTTTSLSLKGRDNLTLKLDSDLAIDSIMEVLTVYFSKSDKQKVIRVIFDDNEVGYLARSDFISSVTMNSRGIGTGDGGTLPADRPSAVKFIELCCSVKGCKRILLVTNYDKGDPTYCGQHKMMLMKPCDET